MADEKRVTTCEFCSYVIIVPATIAGGPEGKFELVCRRYPPIPVFSPQAASTNIYAYAKWPVVKSDWWCGEFKTGNL